MTMKLILAAAALAASLSSAVAQERTLTVHKVVNFGDAQALSYDQLAREPNKYKGTPVCLTGHVQWSQIGHDEAGTYVNWGIDLLGDHIDWTTGRWWELVVTSTRPDENAPRILDGDHVEFCGVAYGLQTWTTAFGVQMTAPLVHTDVMRRIPSTS
jgi:hypothetical protein